MKFRYEVASDGETRAILVDRSPSPGSLPIWPHQEARLSLCKACLNFREGTEHPCAIAPEWCTWAWQEGLSGRMHPRGAECPWHRA